MAAAPVEGGAVGKAGVVRDAALAVPPCDGQLLPLQAAGGVLAVDFQQDGGVGAVGQAGVEQGRDVLKADVGLQGVLHLNHPLQVAVVHGSLHFPGRAQQVHQQVHGVDGLVDQHAAALRLPPAVPAVAVVILVPLPGEEAAGAQDSPGFPAGQTLLQVADGGVVAVLKADADLGALLLGGNQAVKSFPGDGAGLFKQHVDAP